MKKVTVSCKKDIVLNAILSNIFENWGTLSPTANEKISIKEGDIFEAVKITINPSTLQEYWTIDNFYVLVVPPDTFEIIEEGNTKDELDKEDIKYLIMLVELNMITHVKELESEAVKLYNDRRRKLIQKLKNIRKNAMKKD